MDKAVSVNVDIRSELRTLSLCSGGGGLELGVELAVPTARTVCWVEWEAFCCAVLVSRMEAGAVAKAPLWSDLRTFDGKPWRGAVDLVTAGYPCQPFSQAGARRGEDDPRHLWPHVHRVIEEVRPSLVFLENVAGHVGLGLGTVLGDLHGAGYRVTATLVTASEVGASHKRERLFILGVGDGAFSGLEGHTGDGDRCDESGRERTKETGSVGSAGTPVGDAEPVRAWTGDGQEPQAGIGRNRPTESSKKVANGDEWGCCGIGQQEHGGIEGESGCEFYGCGTYGGFDRPLFPPGPGERERWAGILEQWPELAPAVEGRLNPRFVQWLMNFPFGEADYATHRTRSYQALRELLFADEAQTIQWQNGGYGGVPTSEVLQSEVYGGDDEETSEHPNTQTPFDFSQEAPAEQLRRMRNDRSFIGSPQESRLARQSTGEHSDAVFIMPHDATSQTPRDYASEADVPMQVLWSRDVRTTNLQHLPDTHTSAASVDDVWSNRRHWLRLLGNACMPLQAAVAFSLLAARLLGDPE